MKNVLAQKNTKKLIKELNKLIIGKKGKEYTAKELVKTIKKNNQKIEKLKANI